MSGEIEQVVLARLTDIVDPCSFGAGNPMNIVEMGLIKNVEFDNGHLSIQMCLTSPQCLMLEHFVTEARRVTAELPQVIDVVVRGDSGTEWTSDRMYAEARDRRRTHLSRMLPVVEPVHAR